MPESVHEWHQVVNSANKTIAMNGTMDEDDETNVLEYVFGNERLISAND